MKRNLNPRQLTLPHRLFADHDVDVHGEGLRGALVVLRHFTDTPAGVWATVSLVDGRLRVGIRGLEFSAEARGTWRCRIRVPAVFFAHLLAFPPEGAWLNFRIEFDRLVVGQHSVEIDRPWNRAPGQRGSRRPLAHQKALFELDPFRRPPSGEPPLTRREHDARVRLRRAYTELYHLGVQPSRLLEVYLELPES